MKLRKCQKPLNVNVYEVVHVQDFLSWQLIREYSKCHPVLFPLLVAITFGSPLVGLVFTGWLGVSVGLIIGVITLLVGLRAVKNFRETQGGH
jgi:hypothetical protein